MIKRTCIKAGGEPKALRAFTVRSQMVEERRPMDMPNNDNRDALRVSQASLTSNTAVIAGCGLEMRIRQKTIGRMTDSQ